MRKHWIDNLRWVTVVLVLIYHAFYYFNNKGVFGGIGGFDPDPTKQPQDILLYILYPWFMILLFLVAGISSRYSLERHTAKEFLKSRTTKLLVPSTIGLLVFQWMTGYYNTLTVNPFASLPLLVRWPVLALSGIGPLWFIQDLWVFTLLLIPLSRLERFRTWCGKAHAPVIVLLGLLVWLSSQVMVMNPNPESLDGLFNLYRPVLYFTAFLLGYFVFSNDAVQEKVGRMHLPMLVCAVISGTALVWTGWGKTFTDPSYLTGWLNCLFAWFMILAMLGCFKTWFDRTDRFCDYMTRSSFGLYIVHYLIVASVGYTLKTRTGLAPLPVYVIELAAVLLLSPALYELLRRIPFVRWAVLGMSRRR